MNLQISVMSDEWEDAELAAAEKRRGKRAAWVLGISVTLVFVGLIVAWTWLISTALDNKPEVIDVPSRNSDTTE